MRATVYYVPFLQKPLQSGLLLRLGLDTTCATFSLWRIKIRRGDVCRAKGRKRVASGHPIRCHRDLELSPSRQAVRSPRLAGVCRGLIARAPQSLCPLDQRDWLKMVASRHWGQRGSTSLLAMLTCPSFPCSPSPSHAAGLQWPAGWWQRCRGSWRAAAELLAHLSVFPVASPRGHDPPP